MFMFLSMSISDKILPHIKKTKAPEMVTIKICVHVCAPKGGKSSYLANLLI